MKKYTFTLLLVILFLGAYAQNSIVLEGKCLESKVLGETVSYTIYLPAGYNISERTYPILYLLHGLGDDHTGWLHKGNMQQITDLSVKENKSIPMIIVMPNAKRTWYVNDYKGKYRYEDMFFDEFIPHIESTYRVKGEKHLRSVAGLSMGGHGALIYSLHRPDMFGRCFAMGAAVYTQEDLNTGRNLESFALLYGEGLKKGEVTEHWKKNNALYLMETMPKSQKNTVKFYIDCGDDDFLYRGNSSLHILMRDKGIKHEYRVRDGAHRWYYWQECLDDCLEYISNSMLNKREFTGS